MEQSEPITLEASEIVVSNNGQPAPRPPGGIAKQMFVSAVVLGSANAVYLVINAILTILLPRYLTVADYGLYRLFLLYGGFVGLLHFGFLDGLLTRWAANPENLIPTEMRSAIVFLMFQLTAGLLILGFIAGHLQLALPGWFWIALAAFAVVLNGATLVQYALQARKAFKRLSVFMIVQPAILLIIILALKMLRMLDVEKTVWAYLLSTLAAGMILWMFLPPNTCRGLADVNAVVSTAKTNLTHGWGILLANLCMNFTLVADRVLVSAKFSIEEFAFYSFAVSVLAIIYSIMASLTRVVLPYLSQSFAEDERLRVYRAGRDMILLLWVIGISAYFLLPPVARMLLPKYVQSVLYVRLLILGTGFASSIQILHSNFFRIAHRQNLFFVGCLSGLLITSSFLMRASQSSRLQNIAIAMVVGLFVWWLIGECLLTKIIGLTLQDILKPTVLSLAMSAALLFSSSIRNEWLGLAAYLGCAVLVSTILLQKPVVYAVNNLNAWYLSRGLTVKPL